ncbi:MAG: YggS family pyridoxal phosphate-dependent enzyme [Muribaculaceae bacterium]|nr:YggS family pyridoxal phosphate-dependent enzyme [Muribaculaceae bacterium]
MNDIAQQIFNIKQELPSGVVLVAVSKFHPIEALMAAYNSGQRIFGESRVQELIAKVPHMPADAEWHFIGHLQTNKVKSLLPCVSMIQSVDSLKLLKVINDEAAKIDKIVDVLLEFHVTHEDSKTGFTENEFVDIETELLSQKYNNVRFCGIMGMATNTDDQDIILSDFSKLHIIFDKLKQTISSNNPEFKTLSMGMSEDYKMAVSQGSNMVRVGSSIFGIREY